MDSKIDFVVTWVDGSDPKWLKEKESFLPKEKIGASAMRYKDWGLFKYWFRGVEKFAPWVNKIYFVTWGHVPEWLNIDNPKLVIINHKDYIPKEYLPTFNSNVIELNLNKIESLSEEFVLFNDDMYLIDNTIKSDFFKNGKIREIVSLNVHCPQRSNLIQSISNNNVGIINDYFDFKEILRKNKKIWYNLKNGKMLARTIVLSPCPRFPGFWQSHLPVSHLKSTFDELWDKENQILKETSSHHFRESTEVNHWMMKDWNIVSGKVENRSTKFGKAFFIRKTNLEEITRNITEYIRKQKGKTICINDSDDTDERYAEKIGEIKEAFETILPEKSSFEK